MDNWVFHKCFYWIQQIQWQKYLWLKGLEPTTFCVTDQDATTVPARHMWGTGSLNWAQFILQWFVRFLEFPEFTELSFHLGKTPICQKAIRKDNMSVRGCGSRVCLCVAPFTGWIRMPPILTCSHVTSLTGFVSAGSDIIIPW